MNLNPQKSQNRRSLLLYVSMLSVDFCACMRYDSEDLWMHRGVRCMLTCLVRMRMDRFVALGETILQQHHMQDELNKAVEGNEAHQMQDSAFGKIIMSSQVYFLAPLR